jgi:hypothetical protein
VLLLLCATVAGIFSFILYRKSQHDSPLTSTQIKALSALRFLSVFLIAALLLQLAVQHIKHRKQKPELLIGIDNSESLNSYQEELLAAIDQLKSGLREYDPEILLFDSETRISNDVDFEGKRSDYSNLLAEINQNYISSNIGALVLLGDGIFNAGTDPSFAAESVNYPIYSIGFGDTTLYTDAAIRNVLTNSSAFLEQNFPVQLDLSFTKAAGQIVNLTIQESSKTVYSKAIRIQSDNYFFTENLSLKPGSEGIVNYTVRLDEISGEQNLANNTHEFSVNVISEKQQILFLARGPHPDLGAISQALEGNTKYETELITSFSNELDFKDYDLVIVHQLPDASPQSLVLMERLLQSRRPALFILGKETAISGFNNLQTGFQLQQSSSFEQVTALVEDQFSMFRFDPTQMSELQNLPPLLVPFADVTLHPALEVFAMQSIQSIKTDRPLIVFGRVDGQKRGFIAGEGIWRWRIHNYLNDRSHILFDELVQKTINYLILKPNEDNFNLFWETEYNEDEPVIIQAELFNESFELDNSPDVEIEFTHEDGQTYEAVFDKINEKYQLTMGRLPVGNYSFLAQTMLGDANYSESGSFSVSKIQIEGIETEANFQVLSQMAYKTGGDFFLPGQLNELIQRLEQNASLQSRQIEQQVYREFLSMKWLFFIILFLLALEWFLRKFWGIY